MTTTRAKKAPKSDAEELRDAMHGLHVFLEEKLHRLYRQAGDDSESFRSLYDMTAEACAWCEKLNMEQPEMTDTSDGEKRPSPGPPDKWVQLGKRLDELEQANPADDNVEAGLLVLGFCGRRDYAPAVLDTLSGETRVNIKRLARWRQHAIERQNAALAEGYATRAYDAIARIHEQTRKAAVRQALDTDSGRLSESWHALVYQLPEFAQHLDVLWPEETETTK